MNAEQAHRIHQLYCAAALMRAKAERTEEFMPRIRRMNSSYRLRAWAYKRMLDSLDTKELLRLCTLQTAKTKDPISA